MSTPWVGGAGVSRVSLPFSGVPVPEARRLQIPNDDLVALLYDESHLDRIVRRRPSLLRRFTPESALRDPVLRDLALRGTLLAYEVCDDRDLTLEVRLGGRVERSRRAGPWLRPQHAFLDLPTGRLRIDSLLTFGAGPTSAGELVEVPPERYIVTVERYDWYRHRMAPRLWEEPAEMITLTPVGQMRLSSRPPAMLVYPEPPVDPWEGRYTTEGGTFRGELVGDIGALNSLALNLDEAAVAAIGLLAGMQFDVEVGAHTLRGLFLGDMTFERLLEQHGAYTVSELRAAAPFLGFLDRWWRPRRRFSSSVLMLMGDPKRSYDFSGLRAGMSATLTLHTDTVEPLPWVWSR